MGSFRPVKVFALAVPPGEEAVPPITAGDFPATFRLTMAAIDPTLSSAEYAQVNGTPVFTGSTLKLIRIPEDDDDSEDDSDDENFDLDRLLGAASSDEDEEDDDDDDDDDEDDDEDSEEEDEDDEEVNGGPSDPSKSPKAKREAALKNFKDALKQDGYDMEIDDGDEDSLDLEGSRLTAKQKGKAKALDLEDMDDSDSDLPNFQEPEEMVLCTLDLSRNYQQPLDITVNEHETVLFQASGTHTVYLTGNILFPEDLTSEPGMFDPDDDEDMEYDLSPDDEELDIPSEDESDELDDIDDPRVTEVDSEQEDEDDADAPPKLIAPTKNKNKRAREDSDDEVGGKPSVDSILNKSLKSNPSSDKPQVNGDSQQLSKNQQKKLNKKLKDNAGNGVDPGMNALDGNEDVGVAEPKKSQSPAGSTKKVQFASTLVQGPSSSANGSDPAKTTTKTPVNTKADTATVNGVNNNEAKPSKPSLGTKMVQGVTVEDRKLGSGPVAKKGDKVSMRYIGKLEKNKKVFDSNKKGKPFTFQLGASQVIKGWDIGVQGMSVGGERRITIPPALAYGNRAQGNDIPANSTLQFDIKMLNIA